MFSIANDGFAFVFQLDGDTATAGTQSTSGLGYGDTGPNQNRGTCAIRWTSDLCYWAILTITRKPMLLGPSITLLYAHVCLGLTSSVAFEFDMTQNAPLLDPSDAHISIHTNNLGSNNANESYSLWVCMYSTLATMNGGLFSLLLLTWPILTMFSCRTPKLEYKCSRSQHSI